MGSGCGWGTGLATGAESWCPQKQPSAQDGQGVILVSGGHSRCLFRTGSWRSPVAHSGSCVIGHHQYWLPSRPCTLTEASWVTSQRSYLPLNPLLSLHLGSPTQAIIVPALRGSRWGFPSACKAQNGACKYRRCSQSSSSNTPRSAWSLCLGSCCFRRLLCLSLPLHPAQAKSFWIHLSTRLLSEAFPDHLLHLARSGLPPLCFHWLPSSVRAFTPSMTILCGPSLLPIILRGQRPCLSALWFFGGKREHAYVS